MRRTSGLTLLEVLIALFVFGIVATIATQGVVSALRVQGVNEAATSAQAKLRRITEVFTQELRSAVLGGVTNSPYTSGSKQISFLLLDGGAGYQVVTSLSAENFKLDRNTVIAAAGNNSEVEADLNGGQILMVNSSGDAVVMTVTGFSTAGSVHTLAHSACRNTIDFTQNTLVFSVRTLGIRYDTNSGTLFQIDGGGSEQALAFDLTNVNLDYVYQEANGTPHTLSSPILVDGNPVKSGAISGTPVTLARVQLLVAADEPLSGGETLTRSYTGQVEMASNPTFQIRQVVTCDS